MDAPAFAVAGIVIAAYAVQTISGFGSTLLALTLGAHIYSIPEILLLVVPLTILQCGYVSLRHHEAIDWTVLLRRVLPIMGLGVAAGALLSPRMEGPWLRLCFAALVVILSVRELYRLLSSGSVPRALGRAVFGLLLLGAGVIHGIYATGGPMLVYALNKSGMSKATFRSTLTVVWLALNSLLTANYVRTGALDADAMRRLLMIAPAVPIGVVIGELLHHRINERKFRIVIFVMLTVAASSLLLRG